jgi:hypothetical protein
MARRREGRLAEKTVERQFLYELERGFELATATSRALSATAQQVRKRSARGAGRSAALARKAAAVVGQG